ncbi:hypothetical protein C8258_30155 [Nocardia sp. MDA0666]|nr:hypothetical protein C8258_30155 [Nocardia sp. MDA0666]
MKVLDKGNYNLRICVTESEAVLHIADVVPDSIQDTPDEAVAGLTDAVAVSTAVVEAAVAAAEGHR